MSEPPTSREVYLALRRRARDERRGTQELFEFYLLERFLYRLSVSQYRDRFVLKGGLLLTVLGVRRPTRDADVLARNIAGDDETLLAVVKEVASIPVDDGIAFDTSQARSPSIPAPGSPFRSLLAQPLSPDLLQSRPHDRWVYPWSDPPVELPEVGRIPLRIAGSM